MTQEHLMARALPPLPLENWEGTKETLHRYCQIAGKVRMELSPFRNHWWHVTLYVTTRGLSTGPIAYGPHGSAAFDISFDLLDNRLAVTTSDDGGFYFALDDLTVRSEEHTSELQSRQYLVCRLLLEKKKNEILSSVGGDTNNRPSPGLS